MTILTTTVSKRSQTAVPAVIRKQHNIQPGDTLAWIDDGASIKIIPLRGDPIQALRGCAKDENLMERLLAAREEERARDRHAGA